MPAQLSLFQRAAGRSAAGIRGTPANMIRGAGAQPLAPLFSPKQAALDFTPYLQNLPSGQSIMNLKKMGGVRSGTGVSASVYMEGVSARAPSGAGIIDQGSVSLRAQRGGGAGRPYTAPASRSAAAAAPGGSLPSNQGTAAIGNFFGGNAFQNALIGAGAGMTWGLAGGGGINFGAMAGGAAGGMLGGAMGGKMRPGFGRGRGRGFGRSWGSAYATTSGVRGRVGGHGFGASYSSVGAGVGGILGSMGGRSLFGNSKRRKNMTSLNRYGQVL